MDEVNITYITLSGYVEMNRLKYFYFTVMLMVYILIFLSNGTIVYIICVHKNLHEPMYIFIAALLFNSVVYSTNVYPKLLIDFLSERQIIKHSSCIFQLFIFYSVGGSEFFLLAVMAFDKYVSICKPLKYPTIMRKSTVTTSLLVLACFVPACHIGGEAILISEAKLCHLDLDGIFCNNAIFTLHCVKSRALTIFGVVSLLNLVMLPVVFTIFTYTKILMVSYKSSKTFRKAAEKCVPHLLVLINFSYLSTYDVVIARVESDFPKAAYFVMTLQIFLYQPLFNPFIYGFKMKEISKHLKMLLSLSKLSGIVFLLISAVTLLVITK